MGVETAEWHLESSRPKVNQPRASRLLRFHRIAMQAFFPSLYVQPTQVIFMAPYRLVLSIKTEGKTHQENSSVTGKENWSKVVFVVVVFCCCCCCCCCCFFGGGG